MNAATGETESRLAARLREALKEHQRDGLNMIGNVEKLVGRLVTAVHDWLDDEQSEAKKSA
ncbi:MAG TPA: hypothetical protein VJA94_21605 [Candidatus Angelobacter sp.]